ncbi:MAG: glutathione S-transferase family protein [Roseovarius sp.]|nr:glutathione S-transferase family protein [Roseovarius sp.]
MIRLHHVPLARSFRVLWLMEEMGLDYELRYHSIREGTMRSPEFRALSPAGRVPVLEHHGAVWFESGAIVQLLCESYPQAGLMPPPESPERARWLEMLHYAETMGSILENLNLNLVFLRPPARPSVPVVKLLKARLGASLAGLEARLEGDHLLPTGFSAADIMVGYGFELARYYVDLEDWPRLAAYWQRLRARPAHVRARARDGEQDIYARDFYPVPEEG